MKCISYFDALERKSAFYSPTGDGTLDQYELIVNKNGDEELVKTKVKRNVFEEIQAFRESSDITNIINRFMNGERDVLNATQGAYIDVTDAPTSYAEYFQKVKEAEKIFNQLPDEVKDRFDNSAEKFFLEFGTDSFNEKVNGDSSVIEDANVIKEEFDNAE